jgi:inosine-uridine nucleoside N-ribohydrolase
MSNQPPNAVILSAAKNLYKQDRVPHVSMLRRGIPQMLALTLLVLATHLPMYAQTARKAEPQLVIIDTDIGDDIDDAFALALAERSPELHILGITTAFGDTETRAQLTLKFLEATGYSGVPVAAGIPTPAKTNFTQDLYTTGGQIINSQHLDGPDFLLEQIHKHPGQITLIAIGPQTNLAAAIDKDRTTFRKLKRIVMMGGSVDHGYGKPYAEPEWNIVCDIPAARKVFASSVPIYMMPLDSTMLRLEPAPLQKLFDQHTPLTEQLHTLYGYWSASSKQTTPTLFDPMAVAYTIQPDLCPTTPLHLSIDDKGMTIRSAGMPNVNACLKSDPKAFFSFYLGRTAGAAGR